MLAKSINLKWIETRLAETERREGVIEKWLLMEEGNVIGEAYTHGTCGHGVLAQGFAQIDTESGLRFAKEWVQNVWIEIRTRNAIWITSLIMLLHCY